MKHSAHVLLEYGQWAIPVEHIHVITEMVKLNRSWDSATNQYIHKLDPSESGLTLLSKEQVGVIIAEEKLK
jgi:hypothetical protein